MTTTALWYGNALVSAFSKKIDFLSDTIKAGLSTSSYVPDQDAHVYLSDITNEVTGGSYVRETLGTKTLTYTAGTNTLALGCATITFPGVTIPDFRYLWIFDDTGVAGTSPLICYYDFGSAQVASAQDVTCTIAAGGLATLTVS